jgi:glyoxylase-like metal-dependent hydrolase (beta-lactamase superfamily II)
VANAASQTSADGEDMVSRFVRGRAVINAAVEAAGGAQAIRALGGISYSLDIVVANDIQGYRASDIGKPARDGTMNVINRFDLTGNRFSQSIRQDFESGYDSGFTSIWAKQIQYAVRDVPRDYSKTENAPSPFAAGGAFMVAARWLPPVILQRASQNARSLSWAGEATVAGDTTDIVEFSFDEFTRFRVFVARGDRRVRRVETIAPDPVSADDVTVSLFNGEQRVGGVAFPTEITSQRRGATNQKITLGQIVINPAFKDADFEPPAGYAAMTFPGPKVQAQQVGGRVYEVTGLAGGTYQVPFVVMDDYVVAYEAPLGIGATRQVIAEIRRVAGDKPIRYVVVSHFHADHAGGIGAYAEIGATILSSAGNQAILQQYAVNNRPRSAGQEGPRPDVKINFQPVPDKGMTLVDGKGGKLEIIDFAANSHVEHMLALYDPESGIFMGADHHIGAVSWNPTFGRTADWVRKNRKVQKLTGVHDRPMERGAFLARATENGKR